MSDIVYFLLTLWYCMYQNFGWDIWDDYPINTPIKDDIKAMFYLRY